MILIGVGIAIFAIVCIYSLLSYFYGVNEYGVHQERLSQIKDSVLSSNSIRVEGGIAQSRNNESVNAAGETMNYQEFRKKVGNKRYVIPLYKLAILMVLCGSVGGTLLWVLYEKNVDSTTLLLVAVVVVGIVLYIPRIMYLIQKNKIQEQVSLTFPNSLDLLNVCLEAGGGFDQSLIRVAFEIKKMAPILSEEFIHVNQEINAGKQREKALTDMARRLNVDEVTSVVSSIIQAEKLGGSLVGSLRVQAETLRDKVKQRMRTKIAKVPVKLIFPMALTLMPVIMLLILGPVGVSIFKEIISR